MATATQKLKLIKCGECGTSRTVTARHARRKPKTCRNCKADLEDYRVFWLENFSDLEICLLTESIFRLPLGTVRTSTVRSMRMSVASGTVTTL